MSRLTEKIDFISGYPNRNDLYRPCNNSSKIECYKKLGQYEDNDDKIGINYNIVTQALLKGVYYIEFGTTQIKHTNGLSLQAFDGKRFCLANKNHCFIMEDYGKSKYNPWALTKEELEK